MVRVEKVLGRHQLAAIFTFSALFERNPLPFRLQPDLLLMIPFEEWLYFVEQYESVDLISTPINLLRDLSSKYRSGDEQAYKDLISYFSVDICYANIKQAYYSSLQGKEAALVVPDFDVVSIEVSWDEVEEMYKLLAPSATAQFDSKLKARGYNTRPTYKSTGSCKLATYAFFASGLSQTWCYKNI